jgi:hypothetical protein
MTKPGLEAVREHIRKSFLEVHHDQRDRVQVQSDRELLEVLNEPDCEEIEIEQEPQYNATAAAVFHSKAQALANAAMRSPRIHKRTPHRGDVGGCWLIEAPSVSAEALIAMALRELERE